MRGSAFQKRLGAPSKIRGFFAALRMTTEEQRRKQEQLREQKQGQRQQQRRTQRYAKATQREKQREEQKQRQRQKQRRRQQIPPLRCGMTKREGRVSFCGCRGRL